MSGGSTFGSFEIGRRAIHAQQRGAHVAGQNIANANTEGYSRQRVDMSALVPPAVPGASQPPGYGVKVADVTRVKSEFYDDQLRKALTSQQYWEARKDTLSAIEVTFQEPGDQSINSYLSEFFDAWQDVSVNPESEAARISLREQASTLTGIVRDIDDRLKDYNNDVNKELEANIEQINSIASELADLNDKIVFGKAINRTFNELLDERDLRLEELSELIDVRVMEKDNGAVEVMAGGRILLHDDLHFPLQLEQDEATGELEIYNSSGNHVQPQGGEMKGLLESYNEIIPKYKGNLDQLVYNLVTEVNHLHREGYGLDGSTGLNFFEPWETPMPGDIVIDPETLELGEDEEENITGLGMSENPQHQLFSGDYTMETIEDFNDGPRLLQDEDGEQYIPTYSQNGQDLVNSVTIADGGDEINSSIAFEVTKIDGDEVLVNYEYRHITRGGETEHVTGVKRLNAGEANTFSVADSELELSLDLADAGNFTEGDKFVINTIADDGDAKLLTDEKENEVFGVVLEENGFNEETKDFSFFQLNTETGEHREINLDVTVDELESEDPAASFTVGPYEPEEIMDYIGGAAQNFQISDDIEDTKSIAASSKWADLDAEEPGNGHKALDIAGLREKMAMSDGTATFQEYLRGFIADLGVEGRESERMSHNMGNVANSMREQEQAVSSVSLDDEMLDLLQFQHAYNAAAKFLSTFDQMLATLISEVGR